MPQNGKGIAHIHTQPIIYTCAAVQNGKRTTLTLLDLCKKHGADKFQVCVCVCVSPPNHTAVCVQVCVCVSMCMRMCFCAW